MKPVLFVTGHAPAYRVGGLSCLHEREGIEVALFGGRSKHGGSELDGELPFPNRRVRPWELRTLSASGSYRAVVCPTGGRLAPLATWGGARQARVPVILWASLWAHPRSAAHAISYLPLRRLYGSADAVVTYGPHVSRYVKERGAHNVHVAVQSVDNDFWSAPVSGPPSVPGFPSGSGPRFLFVGRPAPEKGLGVLVSAWREARLEPGAGALVVAGVGPNSILPSSSGDVGAHPIVCLDALRPRELREVYAACDVLVVPSVATRTFREPWGLVVNEAMNQGLAIIATDAVGAAAGGLVHDGQNGVIVPAGDSPALAEAIERLAQSPPLRAQMGASGAEAVRAYTDDAWAAGFSGALDALGLSRSRW